MDPLLRCSDVSSLLGEPLAGSAPSDERWLFVEHPGPWGPKAPADVLPAVAGVRVQLIRRVGRTEPSTAGIVNVFAVDLTAGVRISTVTLGSVEELASAGPFDSWPSYDGLLWMVCTNGRRDECCAVRGRPVAAALAERWPDQTWETTHLGGHRFAPTLLALPSGHVLGRVTPSDVVAACESLAAGTLPVDLSRGRAGLPAAAQAAELFVRSTHGLTGLADVTSVSVLGPLATVTTTAGEVLVRVSAVEGEPRRTSCADVGGKPVTTYVASAV